MVKVNYKKVYERAARSGGWSKKQLDKTTKWGDFYELVKTKLQGTEVVLDIGTAEGNRFMGLSKYIKKGVGIDLEPGMIKLANRNKREAGITNITFKCLDAEHLDFPPETFDVITFHLSTISFPTTTLLLSKGPFPPFQSKVRSPFFEGLTLVANPKGFLLETCKLMLGSFRESTFLIMGTAEPCLINVLNSFNGRIDEVLIPLCILSISQDPEEPCSHRK